MGFENKELPLDLEDGRESLRTEEKGQPGMTSLPARARADGRAVLASGVNLYPL